MKRRIISIDETLCTGCGLCAEACHEGAIIMENGKAKLGREDFCDGLGDCLPACPANAISFEEREAPAYNEAAVQKAKAEKRGKPCGCRGSQPKSICRKEAVDAFVPSQLTQWPVQIKLAPLNAPYFDGADLLVAADCTAYAYGNFHNDFIRGRVVLVGCPKLDGVDYAEKLTYILAQNNIQSVTVVRMEVPCCTGLENAVKAALQASGKEIPCRRVIVSIDGQLSE